MELISGGRSDNIMTNKVLFITSKYASVRPSYIGMLTTMHYISEKNNEKRVTSKLRAINRGYTYI